MSEIKEMTDERSEGAAGETDRPVSDQVMQKVHEATDQVQQAATGLRGRVSGSLQAQVDERSSQVGEQLAATGRSLRETTGELRSGGSAVAADGVEQLGQLVERVGGYLSDSNADRILADVERLVRRRPWAAACGGFVVGLVASRLVKASSASRYSQHGGDLGMSGSSGRAWSPAESNRAAPTPAGGV
jgi:hypothetical protein